MDGGGRLVEVVPFFGCILPAVFWRIDGAGVGANHVKNIPTLVFSPLVGYYFYRGSFVLVLSKAYLWVFLWHIVCTVVGSCCCPRDSLQPFAAETIIM